MIGLGLENWSMREDKDYQTRQARPIFVAMEHSWMVQLQCFQRALVMQGLDKSCIQPTTLDKLFKV